MKSIFQINTVYQLFITINMRLHNMPEGDVDLIVTDHTPVLKEYISNLSESGLFGKVYYVESLVFNKRFWSIHNDNKAEFFYNSEEELKTVFSEPQIHYFEYDNLFVANLDAYTKFVYRTNRELKIFLIEDGASICTNDWREATKRWNYINEFNLVYDHVEALYLYTPELMCIDLGYTMRPLPRINQNEPKIVEIYNKIFDYDKSFKFPKFVFLEEPFQADKIMNNDLELMKLISNEVGYNNFFIKEHPRNTVNRSKELGLAQQADTPWPFELMLMNNSDVDTVYITVDSGALISTRILFEQDVKTIFLYRIIKGPTRNIAVNEFKLYMDKFCERFKGKNMLVPNTENEFRLMLKCLGGKINE